MNATINLLRCAMFMFICGTHVCHAACVANMSASGVGLGWRGFDKATYLTQHTDLFPCATFMYTGGTYVLPRYLHC